MAQKLSEIVSAIADGRVIDWETTEQAVGPGRPRRRVQALRTLAAIISAHRTVQPLRDTEPRAFASSVASNNHRAIGTWGSYWLLDILASGTSADVYRAYDPKLDRYIALKLLTPFHSGPSRGDAVIAEGRNLARIRHPNVAAVFAAERIGGRVGIAMELIEGSSLDRVLQTDRTFTFVEVARLGTQLCDALAAVHDAGLVHRDVKSQNLVIGDDNRLVLTDFGTAADVSSAEAGVLAGTPAYSAPEVLHGREATPQSDLYSAAVVMFRLLTRVFPIDADTTVALRAAHRAQRRRAVRDLRPDLPAAFTSIIDQNLAPDPKARFSGAAAMRDALARFTSEAALAAQPATKTYRPSRWLIAALVLAMAVGGLVSSLTRPRVAPSAATVQLPATNFVLVASFENLTGDDELNHAITYAIEDDLLRSRRLAVMPRFRVDQALNRMRRPIDSALNEALAREVSLRDGGVRVIVTGRVTRLGSIFTIGARLLDPETGQTIANVSEDAHSKDALATAARALAQKIIGHLGALTTPPFGRSSTLERATTRSLRALTLYTESYRAGVRARWPAALALARQTVAEDPDFATAQIWLAWCLRRTGAPADEYVAVAERATLLARDADPAERLWIEGSAHDMAGRPIEAEQAYRALLQIEPDHYWAANNMSSVFLLQNRRSELLALQRQRADRYPTDPAANLAAANALVVIEGDFASARVYAERVRTLAADDQVREKVWALTFRASELLARRNIAGMTREVKTLLAAAPAMPPELHDELIDKLVGLLLTTGQVTRAKEASERFHDRGRFYEYARAYAAFTVDDVDLARRHIVKANPARMPMRTALLMTRLQLWKEAEMIAPRPGPSPIFSGDPLVPILTLGRGDVDGAIPLLEAFYARRAPGPHGLVSQDLAEAWRRKQQPERAIAVLREAFEVNRRSDAAATGPHGPLWFESALMLIELCHQHGCDADAARAEADLAELFALADSDFAPLRRLQRLRVEAAAAGMPGRSAGSSR